MASHWVIDWALTFEITNAIITLGSSVVIAWFAMRQWQITNLSERARREERASDMAVQRDTARAALHAEWFRMWTVAKNWQESDLVEWALIGALRDDEILPYDWGAVAPTLGHLGKVSSFLASYAFAVAHDAARAARVLIERVRIHEQYLPPDGPERERYEAEHVPELQEVAQAAKVTAIEAANLLQDALDHVPGSSEPLTVEVNKEFHSNGARQLIEGLSKARLTQKNSDTR